MVDADGQVADTVEADVVLLATGGTPRVLETAEPDGERILSWRELYDLDELPEHLVVVGSGVTGAEFASGYCELGVPVTLVSSRDRVLPGEDADAAEVIEQVFTSRGGTLVKRARASAVKRVGDGVVVELQDGRTVEGSHALMCLGSVPNSSGLGLEHVGIELDERGYIPVDRVSRTVVPSIYAAGDCTGVLLLASVAGMQGRIAMWHALGEAVTPLRLKTVAANVFTHPEIATVGTDRRTGAGAQRDAAAGDERAREDAGPARGIREVLLPSRDRCRHRWRRRRAGRVRADLPDHDGRAAGADGRRCGRNNRGVPVVVGFGGRGRAAADAPRRFGLRTTMANHGDFSPEARERAHRTILVADVFADNAEVIVAELTGVADDAVLVAVVDGSHKFSGTHHVERANLVERVPQLEDGGGWAMVFSPGVSAADIRKRTDEMASIAQQRAAAIDRIIAKRAAQLTRVVTYRSSGRSYSGHSAHQ